MGDKKRIKSFWRIEPRWEDSIKYMSEKVDLKLGSDAFCEYGK
jgi:hypothetical protein